MSDVLVLNADGSPLSMMPLSTITWMTAMKLLALDKITVIKEYDNWEVHSPTTTFQVPSIVMIPSYVRWNRQVKFNKLNIFLRDNFICQYCYSEFGLANLTIDHVKPVSLGGKTTWCNVTTACRDCNSRKGNNAKIVPEKTPYQPTYYELIKIRKQYPLYIKDPYWEEYIDWPTDKIKIIK